MLHLFFTFVGQVQVRSQVLPKQVSSQVLSPEEEIQVKSKVYIRLYPFLSLSGQVN